MLFCPKNLLQMVCIGTKTFRVESQCKNSLYSLCFTYCSSYNQHVIKMVIYMLTNDNHLIKVRELKNWWRIQRGKHIQSIVIITFQSGRQIGKCGFLQ